MGLLFIPCKKVISLLLLFLISGGLAGASGGREAGIAEASKHNVLQLNAGQIDELKVKMAEIGHAKGGIDGEAAGTEAGLKIDIPSILAEAVAAAKAAAVSAAQIAKASEEAAEAQSIQAMVIAGAEEAGELAAIEAAKEAADQAAEEAFLDDIVKICEEEGRAKGTEIFGEFGATVGIEAALLYGKKAGIAKVKEMVVAHAIEMGKAEGKVAGT